MPATIPRPRRRPDLRVAPLAAGCAPRPGLRSRRCAGRDRRLHPRRLGPAVQPVLIARDGLRPRGAEPGPGFAEDLDRRAEEQNGEDAAIQNVGPTGNELGEPARCGQNADVGDDIVAAALECAEQINDAVPESVEQGEAREFRDERDPVLKRDRQTASGRGDVVALYTLDAGIQKFAGIDSFGAGRAERGSARCGGPCGALAWSRSLGAPKRLVGRCAARASRSRWCRRLRNEPKVRLARGRQGSWTASCRTFRGRRCSDAPNC